MNHMDDNAIDGMVNHEVILDDFDDDEVFVPTPEPPLERQLLHIDDPLVWPMNDDSYNTSCCSKGIITVGDEEAFVTEVNHHGIMLDDFDNDECVVPSNNVPPERQLLHVDDPVVWPVYDDSSNATRCSKAYTSVTTIDMDAYADQDGTTRSQSAHPPIPGASDNMMIDSDDEPYWGPLEDIDLITSRPVTFNIDTHMDLYCHERGLQLTSVSGHNNNCLLEAVECALSTTNQTALLFKSHDQSRQELSSYIKRNADTIFHYPGQLASADMPLTFRQHTTALEDNMTWNAYIRSIYNGCFLDIQCAIALSHMHNININIWKFDSQTGVCVESTCQPPGIASNSERPNITIALRDNFHFYAVINTVKVPDAIRYLNCRASNRNATYNINDTHQQGSTPPGPTIPSASAISTLEEIGSLITACKHRRALTEFNKIMLGSINARTLNSKHHADQFHYLYEYGLLFNKLGLDIVGILESRIKGNDICWSDSNYKYFFSGNDNKRVHGVGVAIKLDLYNSGVIKRIIPVNERIIVVCCTLDQLNMSIVIAYAPVDNNVDSEETSAFYKRLRTLRADHTVIPREFHEYTVVMGDLNARVGTFYTNPPDNIEIYGVLGAHITDKKSNANGLKMLEYCNKEELFVANSFFKSTRSTGSNTCGAPIKGSTYDDIDRFRYTSTIDYILMSKNLRDQVEWCQVHEDATPVGSSDHLLVAATIHLSGYRATGGPATVRPTIKGRHKFSTDILHHDLGVREALREALKTRITAALANRPPVGTTSVIGCNAHGAQSLADELFKIRHDVCEATLPTTRMRATANLNWYEDNEQELNLMLKNKHEMYARYIQRQISLQEWQSCRNECTKTIKRIKEKYMLSRANDMVELFEAGDIRGYYEETKKMFGNNVTKYTSGVVDLLPGITLKDGKTKVKSPEAILARWREHFGDLFNQESTVAPNINDLLPQQQAEQSCDSPIMDIEISEALKKIERAKAPGDDGISSDLELLCMTPEYCHNICTLFNACLQEGIVPEQLKHVIIIPLFKKGAQSKCDNYRGISLINVLGKLFERILLERIEPILAQSGIATDKQYGFTYDRNTSDGILTCRVLQSICKEQNKPLYMGFIDLEKAYDRVHRPTLWKILRLLGISPKIVTAIEQLNSGSMARVHAMGAFSTEFPLNNGVKQGSVLSPCLYNVFMGALMTYTLRVCEQEKLGLEVLYQPKANLFDRLDIDSMEEHTLKRIAAALFADDVVLFAPTPEQLQRMMDIFTNTANAFGQRVSASKTEVMASTYGHTNDIAPILNIMLRQSGQVTALKQVDVFKYLGSRIEENGTMNLEIGIRCERMWQAYTKYAETIFLNEHVPLWNKLLLYTTMVIPQATYGCGAWIYDKKQMFLLELQQLRILNRFMKPKGIKWMPMHMAMKIAYKHRWKSLVPLACRVHAMQIKFLAHLITTVKVNEQLHVICRCKLPHIAEDLEPANRQVTSIDTGTMIDEDELTADALFITGINWDEVADLKWRKVHKKEKIHWEKKWRYMKYYRQLSEHYGHEVEMEVPQVQFIWNQQPDSVLFTNKAQLSQFYESMFTELNNNKDLVERSCRATHRAWVRLERMNRHQAVDTSIQRCTTMYAGTIARMVKYFDLNKSLVDFRKKEIVAKALVQGKKINIINDAAVYPGWRRTLKDFFFTKQRLTKFVKEDGKEVFLRNWRLHELKKKRLSRIVEGQDYDMNEHDVNGNQSDSEPTEAYYSGSDEDAEGDNPTYIEVDITNIANAIIGSKGIVIRHFKREYRVEASTIQQGDFTTLHVTGIDKTDVRGFIKTISEYNNDPHLLYQALKHLRKQKLRIFIDISNIVCGLQYNAEEDEGMNERDYSTYLNTDTMLEIVRSLRTLERVVIVGSSPARDNPFWNLFGDSAEIHVLPRTILPDSTSVEVGVDDKLHELMLQDTDSINPHERILVLMSGDGNNNINGGETSFPNVVRHALAKGWKVELWTWARSVNAIYSQIAEEYGEQFIVVFLDNVRTELIYQPKYRSPKRAIKNKRQRQNMETMVASASIAKKLRNKRRRTKFRKRKLERDQISQNNNAEDETDSGSNDDKD